MISEELNWRSFVDRGAITKKWKPAGTLAYFMLDADGTIRYKWAGAPEEEAIDVVLERLIEEVEGQNK